MNHNEPIQIDDDGGIDVSRLSEQVSAACDRWLRSRGLAIEKGWTPKKRKPSSDLENKTAELPP
jgi:hypothetical protein